MKSEEKQEEKPSEAPQGNYRDFNWFTKLLVEWILWKEGWNSEDQQFYQHHQSKQSPCSHLKQLNIKKVTQCITNPGHGLGHAQIFFSFVPIAQDKTIQKYYQNINLHNYMCKTQIDIQPLIDVRFLCHRHLYPRSMSFFQILKSMAISHFLKSISNDVTNVCPTPNINQ